MVFKSAKYFDKEVSKLNEKFGGCTPANWRRRKLRRAMEHRERTRNQRKKELREMKRMEKEEERRAGEVKILEDLIGKVRDLRASKSAERGSSRSSKSKKSSKGRRAAKGDERESSRDGVYEKLLERIDQLERKLVRQNLDERARVLQAQIDGETAASAYLDEMREMEAEAHRDQTLIQGHFRAWKAGGMRERSLRREYFGRWKAQCGWAAKYGTVKREENNNKGG